MFNLKQLMFSSALVVAVYGQKKWLNLTDPCKQAMKSARKPTGAECALPRNRTDADTDRVCGSVDRCIDASKQLIKQGCANEMSLPPVDFMLKYGVEMKFKSKCLKDGSNKYCRKSNQQSFCGECMNKRKELQQQVMANAPQDLKDRASKWQDKKSKCNSNAAGTGSSGTRTNLNGMSRSVGSTFTLNSMLFISTFSALIYSAIKFW
jgi:beta-glucosidase-like glycosyl hydrolase